MALLDEEWAAIAALGDELTGADWEAPSECPGWRVRDLVAHMVGTERSLLGEGGPPPPEPPPAHVHNPIGAANEGWVRSLRDGTTDALLEEFRAVTHRRLEVLGSMTAEDFDRVGPSPVGMAPYREFMNVRVMDCWVHEQDMRVATGRPGHDDGPVADLAIDRIASAMPFVVGKKAAAPDGSIVVFAVTGPTPRRVTVAVAGGRARIDRGDPGPATVEATLDAGVFWRLGCGRISGPDARRRGLVTLAGDDGLGRRVVDAMAFMI